MKYVFIYSYNYFTNFFLANTEYTSRALKLMVSLTFGSVSFFVLYVCMLFCIYVYCMVSGAFGEWGAGMLRQGLPM